MSEVRRVRLSVFDLLGRELAVLVDDVVPSGMHTATWDASGFPSGIYLYRMRTGRVSLTKKLVVVR